MVETIAALMPDGVGLGLAAGLLVFSFVTSLITAMFSLGGGIMMLAGLAMIFPPVIVVPVHGAVQLGSNGGRALVQRAFIQWQFVLWMGIGAVVGSLVGASFAVALPEAVFLGAIAVFILYSVWGPQPRVRERGPISQLIAGTVIAAIGMIIGATGPLVAAFLRSLTDRRQLVATQATLMTVNNFAKIAAFAVFGFAFGQYILLVAGMIVTGFLGTVVGSRALHTMPEHVFRIGFRIIMTVVALDLLRQAAFA
jgi:uncharacterized protein